MKSAKNRTLTIEKTLNANVQQVWDAWTRPEHIAGWWAPHGMPLTVLQHEFKVGGKWKYSMPMPKGGDFISEGTYKEIVEHKKIVTTADFKPMTENVELHITFEARGNQTHFTFSVVHATEEYCRQQEEMGFYNGWGSAFQRLEKQLAEILATLK